MNTDFYRIKRLPPYIFEEVNRIKARLRAEGTDIIDFGMGNPDMPTPPHIIEKLIETVQKPRTTRYSASKGIPGLRKAMANYYGYRFGVKLDPDREVIATLGSKEGFANLAQAITAPGDVVICPEETADLQEAVVHGILHLCGYDHETDEGEMLALQADVMATLTGGTA